MLRTSIKARFWKCALQVNPYSYKPKYQGQQHVLSEKEYNRQLLEICQQENIKVLGIADHGNVDSIDAIRSVMTENGILVFPGFEMASSEKIHFVCLFPEETNTTELNRYLGNLELLNPEDGIRPSRLSAEQLFDKIKDIGGFCYAAHCTGDNGLLKNRQNHIWKNEKLNAAQVPGAVEDLTDVESGFYRNVILNKNTDYQRETPIAIINARDVETPETLKNPNASCLIKMTNPSFEAFKLAFQDPESRVRLNNEVSEKFFSRIESLSITGGYLEGLHIEFSEHLNSVIGGRGTGKSTLLECIRYALDIEPIGRNAKKQHQEIINENIGKSRARIELGVRSSRMNGKRFTIARRYGESAYIKDEAGTNSSFTPNDILPDIELYGQNEIYEIAQDGLAQKELLARYLGNSNYENKIQKVLIALKENRNKLYKALEGKAEIEDELGKLPKLQERINQFKSLGIEDKLKEIPLLEKEKNLKKRVINEELYNLEQVFTQIKDAMPDTVFLNDSVIEKLPHAETLKEIRIALDKLKSNAEAMLNSWNHEFTTSKETINRWLEQLENGIRKQESALEQTFKELPASEGKSGREIGVEYQKLLQSIEKIKPGETAIKTQEALIKELYDQRRSLLDELSGYRSKRSAGYETSLKKLNRKLTDKLKLTVLPESDKQPVIDFLLDCNPEGVGDRRLSWIRDKDDFSPVKLAELIERGEEALTKYDEGITPSVANALMKLPVSKILELQELELPDIIKIELNVSHAGEPQYRSINNLSTGQQCTAILHLLLLENKDPLIMDQPEDNLDNAFIAERIVTELRNAKLNRQFVFATHNANIPVFGDAEWIGIFESIDATGSMPETSQGGIDVPAIRERAANILEGGRRAFNQRKIKYGY